MSTIRHNPRFFILCLLAACVSAGILSAQRSANDYEGKFTLPFEAKWGEASLPPGNYSFKLNTAVSPYTITVRGENRVALIMARGSSDRGVAGRSELILVRRGKTGTIRALHLAEVGEVFTYGAPKAERQVLAKGPELIQRIPVVAAREVRRAAGWWGEALFWASCLSE